MDVAFSEPVPAASDKIGFTVPGDTLANTHRTQLTILKWSKQPWKDRPWPSDIVVDKNCDRGSHTWNSFTELKTLVGDF